MDKLMISAEKTEKNFSKKNSKAEKPIEDKKAKLKEFVKKEKLSKEARKEISRKRKEALNGILKACLISEQEQLVEWAEVLAPKGIVEKKKHVDAAGKLRGILGEQQFKHEDTIWKELHIGRSEMSKLRKEAAKKGCFVIFDLAVGQYKEVEESEFKKWL